VSIVYTPTVIVGPHTLRREGVTRALDSTSFRIVASLDDLEKIELSDPEDRNAPLLILECGHEVSGAVQKIQQFKTDFPGGKVVLLADHLALEEIVSAFRAGTNAYFASVQTCEAFVKALELVMLGESFLPRELLALVERDALESSGGSSCSSGNGQSEQKGSESEDWSRLSEREKFILRCIIDGDSNKHVARKLNIAEATVKVHVKAIFRKIRVQNRTQAAIWAMNRYGSESVTLKAETVPPLAWVSPHNEIATDALSRGQPDKIDVFPPLGLAIDLSRAK
jgi:two-component system nitrate/nitrite response regulator NarL